MRVTQPGNGSAQAEEARGAKGESNVKSTSSARKTRRLAAAEEKGAAAKAGASGAAKTEISTKGREFAQAKAVATAAPETRDDRIAEIKRKIAEKNYRVNSDAVADRLVDDHLKMMGDE